MSKDKIKKLARTIMHQTFVTERERAAKKTAKAARDAKAKRDKRAAARAAREAVAAAGVVAEQIDDDQSFYVTTSHEPQQLAAQA